MHAQGTAHRRHVNQRLQNIGKILSQHGELVNDQQNTRHRFSRVSGHVLLDVVHALTRLSKKDLPAVHLRIESTQSAVCKLLIKVTNGTDSVGQALTRLKSRATLKVDQNKVQVLGRVSGCQTSNESPEELTLTRTCCTAHQAVGAIAHDIEEDLAVVTDTDGGRDTCFLAPQLFDLLRGSRGKIKKFRCPDKPGQSRTRNYELRVIKMSESHGRSFSSLDLHTGKNNVFNQRTVLGLKNIRSSIVFNTDNTGTGRRELLFGMGNHDT